MRSMRTAMTVLLVMVLGGAVLAQAPGEVAEQESQAEEAARDPFRPFTEGAGIAPIDEPLTPLEQYELGQLSVTGVMVDLDPPRAILEDSSGMGFIVTPGTRVGRKRGVIRAIEPGRIIVEEQERDYYGQPRVSRVTLEIASDEGGARE